MVHVMFLQSLIKKDQNVEIEFRQFKGWPAFVFDVGWAFAHGSRKQIAITNSNFHFRMKLADLFGFCKSVCVLVCVSCLCV